MQTLAVVVLDALLVIAAGGLALLCRFDFTFSEVDSRFIDMWFRNLPIQLVITIGIFVLRKMYRYIWKAVSANDVSEMVVTVVLAYLVFRIPTWIYSWRYT